MVAEHGLARIDDNHFVENLHYGRYNYTITRLGAAPERGPARLALLPPAGGRELAQVEVTVPVSAQDWNSLRTERSAFFPVLATLAGQLGGTRFVVSHQERAGQYPWITSLVVDVYAEP